jgi:hypothetical protein
VGGVRLKRASIISLEDKKGADFIKSLRKELIK